VRKGSVTVKVTGSPNAQIRVYNAADQIVGSGVIGSTGVLETTLSLPASSYRVRVLGSTAPTAVSVSHSISELERYDVNGDGRISRQDILVLVDSLNRQAANSFGATAATISDVRFDTSLDGRVSAQDVLLVVDYLN